MYTKITIKKKNKVNFKRKLQGSPFITSQLEPSESVPPNALCALRKLEWLLLGQIQLSAHRYDNLRREIVI
jgi:hypothetical protein